MSELRWTLLILGVVFIAVLSWWERRRPRQAFAPRLPDSGLGAEIRAEEGPAAKRVPAPAGPREPWIGDTELCDAVLSDEALGHAPERREPPVEAPLDRQFEASVPGPLEELPTLVIPDEEDRLALQAAWDAAPPEPTLIDPQSAIAADAPDEEEDQVRAPDPQTQIRGAEGVGAVRVVELCAGAQGGEAIEPIVDWPPEESRRILALRLIALPPERFPGRALRLALAAEGFLLGKFSIFHKPDESSRALISAASLTRPGSFDLQIMDTQRHAGLSLFAVLPGPRPPAQAFEELLATARNLNERLQGALQDDRGGPLTPLRIASIRESLRAAPAHSQGAADA